MYIDYFSDQNVISRQKTIIMSSINPSLPGKRAFRAWPEPCSLQNRESYEVQTFQKLLAAGPTLRAHIGSPALVVSIVPIFLVSLDSSDSFHTKAFSQGHTWGSSKVFPVHWIVIKHEDVVSWIGWIQYDRAVERVKIIQLYFNYIIICL